MIFSDITNKQGLIQECEFWTNLGDGVVSGDATLLKQFTSRINRAYERVLPLVFSFDDTMQWDDPNHTTDPIARTNLVSGQQDYSAFSDEESSSILNVVKVFVLQSATATDYVELKRVRVGQGAEDRILNPTSTFVGIPTEFVELGGRILLGPVPNYAATLGIKIMFERSPVYFTSASTTQSPGIPEPYHQLLALHASKDWLAVNKAEAVVLIGQVKEEIAKIESNLSKQNAARYPKRKRVFGVRTKAE